MSIRYDQRNRRWRFEFDQVIQGDRVRASKLLPKAWGRNEAQAFDQAETARLFGVATGAIRPRILIQQAVDLYVFYRCPHLKSGDAIIKELALIHGYFENRYTDELAEVAKELMDKETAWLPGTIRNRLAYLRAACNYAKKVHGLGDKNESHSLPMPVVRNQRQVYADRADMLRVAKACENREARALVRIAFYSGMRLAEVLAIGKTNAITEDGFLLHDTKNGSSRFAPMHPRVRVLLRYLPLKWKRNWLQVLVRRAMDKVGLEHVRLHDLRHSTASEMVNNDVDLFVVGEILGHKDKRTTERYAHLRNSKLSEAIRKVG